MVFYNYLCRWFRPAYSVQSLCDVNIGKFAETCRQVH